MTRNLLLILTLVMVTLGFKTNKDRIISLFKPKEDATIRIGWKSTHCSAFVISDDTAVTALHCVFDPMLYLTGKLPNTINLYGQDNEVKQVLDVVLPKGSSIDIAKLKGDFRAYGHLKYIPGKLDLSLKDSYKSCGYPYGTKYKYCMPINPKENMMHLMKSKGYITFGFSGGPVINESSGTVVGVNTAIMDGFVLFTPLLGLDGLFSE